VRRNETASFRAYSSPAESFADYVRLLKTSPRYQQALQAGTDVQGFARGLQRAGYATDPRYAAKIAAIAGGPTIERAVSAVADAGSRLGQTFASTATAALGITVVEEPHVQRTFHRYRCPARLPACVGDHQPQRGQPQYARLQPAEGQLRHR
jgi:hypothetical protein